MADTANPTTSDVANQEYQKTIDAANSTVAANEAAAKNYIGNSEFDSLLNDQGSLGAEDNPLNKFKTYNYLFTLAALPKNMYNSGSYPAPGDLPNILIREQGDWDNADRVESSFGAFDYFIDDLIINSYKKVNDNVGYTQEHSAISFTVIEPYSMGLFLESVYQAALREGYKSQYEIAFLLCVEFTGYLDDDTPFLDPSLTRYFTIKITSAEMNVTQAGCTYHVVAYFYSNYTVEDANNQLQQDTKLYGITVEDLLSSENYDTVASLKHSINSIYANQKKEKLFQSTDQIQINFIENPDLPGVPNNIGKAKLFKDAFNAGTGVQVNQNKAYDPKAGITQGQRLTTTEPRNITFEKGKTITEVIKQVIINSDYYTSQINGGAIQTDSMNLINSFIIRPRNLIGSFNPQLGRPNYVWIYDIMPAKSKADMLSAGGVDSNYTNLRNQVSKKYDYIYTGNNTEILSWRIFYNYAWHNFMPTDLSTNPGTGMSNFKVNADIDQVGFALPSMIFSQELSPVNILTGIAKNLGMGGTTTGAMDSTVAQSKIISNLVLAVNDMINLDMSIRGDPYWLPNSASGNYRSEALSYTMMSDTSVNAFSGNQFVIVNFRTPIDLDPETGLYKFTTTLDTVSGLYTVFRMEHRFQKGSFTQKFTNALRLRGQTTTSGNAGNFMFAPGQQGQGDFFAPGSTLAKSIGSMLGSAIGSLLRGGSSNVEGADAPQLDSSVDTPDDTPEQTQEGNTITVGGDFPDSSNLA